MASLAREAKNNSGRTTREAGERGGVGGWGGGGSEAGGESGKRGSKEGWKEAKKLEMEHLEAEDRNESLRRCLVLRLLC